MRILLVAPDMTDLNTVPEVRTMSAAHRVHVLNGVVTTQNIYDAVSNNQYDVIHFATHIHQDVLELDQLKLSLNETIDLNSTTRMARLGGAKLVVFNICLAARFATYMVRNGVPCVIYTTISIVDRTAWELPAAFYEQCRRAETAGETLDFRSIFDMIDDGNGTYGILSSSGYFLSLLQQGIKPMVDSVDEVRRLAESTALLANGLSGRLSALEHKRDRPPMGWAGWAFMVLLLVMAAALAVIAWRLL